MAILGLNLPTDVPWEQICVTEDMMATEACEVRHPPKWRSSIAVARYVPEEEYQVYEGRKVTYLKVTCTITGYQPRDKEVEGQVNFRGISVQTVANVDSLLESYLPCTGALIQVAVSPAQSGVIRENYPYFMDFQPKKRELYEMVTETGERSSRSSESLKVGKASGNSESLEVLDVDQGGSVGVSGGVSYMGVGVNGSYSSSTQGQWGTKQLGSQESSVNRSTDESREKRETESHTTQLSQMYHLLDSYHQGTNRALFFVQPRPHILEVPTGFVRGPRSVEGIQEFFLVVNQPKDQDGFEVSVRLDTSHLTTVPIMDYDRSRSDTITCNASAEIPTRNDPPTNPEQSALRDDDGDRVGTVYYYCFKREAHNSTPYTPPSGYKIDLSNDGGYTDLVNTAFHGSSHVDVDPAGGWLTVFCDAESHVCIYHDHDITVGYWAPDNVEDDAYKWPANVERDVLVHLISREPTKQIGEKHVLLITTRELCCGGSLFLRPGVVDVVGLVGSDGKAVKLPPSRYAALTGRTSLTTLRDENTQSSNNPYSRQTMSSTGRNNTGSCDTHSREAAQPSEQELRAAKQAAEQPPMMTARDANALTDTIREAMIQSAGSRRRETEEPLPYIETDLFHLQLRRQLLQTPAGREQLSQPITQTLDKKTVQRLERHFRMPADEIPSSRIADQSAEDLARILEIDIAAARRLKLASFGITFNSDTDSDEGDEGGQGRNANTNRA